MINEKTLYLMCGIPASGKSTIAEMIMYYLGEIHVAYHSTDDLWYDYNGNYNFDASRLGEMHRLNQMKVKESMKLGKENIIVDNTNTTQKEAKPYIEMAKEHNYTVRVVSVSCNIDVAKAYNAERPKDRQVPEAIIDKMNERITRIKL